MGLEWLTYSAAAERLGISPEAVRQKSIRAKWSKRTGNDGRAEIRVDVDELRAAAPPKHHHGELIVHPSDTGPTAELPPVDHQADTRTLDALDAHIATLKTMVAKAEHTAERERERMAEERVRADAERARADGERNRADSLAAELVKVRSDGAEQVAGIEHQVAELREMVDTMRAAPSLESRPWWRRLAG